MRKDIHNWLIDNRQSIINDLGQGEAIDNLCEYFFGKTGEMEMGRGGVSTVEGEVGDGSRCTAGSRARRKAGAAIIDYTRSCQISESDLAA